MVKKKKVTKKNPGKQVNDTLASLKDLDKNISKAMKNMNASIHISIQTDQEKKAPKKKKKVVKKK